MSSKTDKPQMHSAAWRISFWATIAFAFGTVLIFVFLHIYVAGDIQRRSDAWLTGEVELLGDVAERTPKDALYDRVVSEVAELASKEVPNRIPSNSVSNDSVFFLQTGSDGSLKLWVGAGDGMNTYRAIEANVILRDHPIDLHISGISIPFRVAVDTIEDGSRIYLGLSERDELRVLMGLRLLFFVLWLLIVFLGFSIVFYTSRRMLSHVRHITEAASKIGHSDLSTRVPTTERNDEIANLALTLNRMLDRIESSMRQLHTITDSLAHDLRSPVTAIRGKLEMSLSSSLSSSEPSDSSESIVAAIEDLDRLTEFLTMSLDVAEAKADALRLNRIELDLDQLLRAMIDLYEPLMAEKGLRISLRSSGPVIVSADAALVHRMVANLFDNEIKHLTAACSVTIELQADKDGASILIEDDGPGFDGEVLPYLFERRVKGKTSSGYGLGLAFVDAVMRAHGGSVSASNRIQGGVQIRVHFC